jgi:branched-chain amino acid aminotransferase
MAGFTKAEFIWMNGTLMPWDQAQVHVTAHALQYGTGVFEGMRSYDTPDGAAIFRLDAHIKRLAASASHYDLDIPYSYEQLCDASLEVVRSNGFDNAYLRPIAFFDSFSFSVWPKECPVSVAIIAVPGKPYLAAQDQGVRIMLSQTRRIDRTTLTPYVKACGHYMNSVRASQEALRAGYDDAMLLNTAGEVAEGSGANLFIIRNGAVVTNDMDASIVMGITRDSVIEMARDMGLPVEIRTMTVDDLEHADEMFFSGTAVEITPIRQLDTREVSDGPGPITKRLQKTFFDAVHGRLPQYKKWLSHVDVMAARTS